MMRIMGSSVQLAAAGVLALQLLLALPALPQSWSAKFESQSANLTNATSTIRIAAIRALAQLDDEEIIAAVPLIAERLRDEDPKVRIVAARVLGHLGELAREAVTDIGQALNDGQYAVTVIDGGVQFQSVAMSAAAALADLGPNAPAALKDLLRALKSNDARLRAAAAKAIGYMGGAASQANSALVSALSDPSAETRFEAAFALGQIGPLPVPAVTALKNSLSDMGIFVETLSSGAEVVGLVRVAAAEALLNLDQRYLAVIKRHGGDIRQSEEEPELPWLSGRRLRLAVDETDIRDLIAVVLMANQMTVSFRRDIEGYLTFEFLGMPTQGAFNMLLHEYNLSYEWDGRRRHVSIFPYKSVTFPGFPATAAALTKSSKLIERQSRAEHRGRQNARIIDGTHATSSVPKTATVVKSIKPSKKARVRIKKIVVGGKLTSKVKAKVSGRSGTTIRTTTNSLGGKKPKILAARQPATSANSIQSETSTDISDEHKLSFIIKYDGLYRAMIDGQEYTAGMKISTARGGMVIVEIRKRAVHLLQKSDRGFKKFVLRHRRRR